MKTFQQFQEDAALAPLAEGNPLTFIGKQINKLTGIGSAKPPTGIGSVKPPIPKAPANTNVLAYKNYKSGSLNKSTGKFTQRNHTPAEAERYGWKPKTASSYGPKDTTSQGYNTGSDNVQRTADGTPFTGSTRGVAVPYKYKKGEVPKGTWAGTPSTKFNTNLQITQKPMGTSTKVTNAKVRDTGNFGAAGEVNKSTDMDLMRQTARDVSGNPSLSPTEWGKKKVYVKQGK